MGPSKDAYGSGRAIHRLADQPMRVTPRVYRGGVLSDRDRAVLVLGV